MHHLKVNVLKITWYCVCADFDSVLNFLTMWFTEPICSIFKISRILYCSYFSGICRYKIEILEDLRLTQNSTLMVIKFNYIVICFDLNCHVPIKIQLSDPFILMSWKAWPVLCAKFSLRSCKNIVPKMECEDFSLIAIINLVNFQASENQWYYNVVKQGGKFVDFGKFLIREHANSL